jgi:hypothetical protein
MAAKKTDTEKSLEEFLNLVPRKIDEVAKKFRSKPVERIQLAELLDGLSRIARQSASDFTKALRSAPKAKRDELLQALEKAGVTNTAKMLTTVSKTAGLLDNCLALHEAAKAAALAADIFEIWAPEVKPIWIRVVLTALKTVATAADIAAQICDDKEAKLLEQKIDFIMDLPDGVDVPSVPDDETPTSLTMVRKLLEELQQKIDFIMDLPPGVDVPPVPKNETPTSLTTLRKLLEVAKKFYKFEGFFRPTFRKDKQLIRIGPLATSTLPSPPVPILVTGLINLGGMQNHDVVTITTKVLEPTPSPQYVIWRVKTFTGPQTSGIKHFQDFADLLEVPADGVEILIAQSASSHNFDPAFLLTIPYQFLVETTILPDFNVS